MREILFEELARVSVGRQHVELVERKGVGHPDSMCDAIMESVSVALCREYLEAAGRVLHHNVDKGLLVAGQTSPAVGGGTVEAPMRLIFGDRATGQWHGQKIPVGEIAEAAARHWITQHLRFVDPSKHLVFQNELQAGSPELLDIFSRDRIGANDTSAAVGYAPMTETERLVLAAEHLLNSRDFKERFPEVGEDIKVMGLRRGRDLHLTVALAFVDRFVPSEQGYFARKEAIRHELLRDLGAKLQDLDSLHIDMNTLDMPGRGPSGMYLTVLGTSAEGADGGQVGRGNRVNGVISLNRPMSTEAAAGKNPVSHVGKIYNLLSYQIANHIYSSVPGIEEVYVWLCSQIGHPVDQPWIASAQVVLKPDAALVDVEPAIKCIINEELADIQTFCQRLARGELAVC
jgi:S-adenosylmethionine synthetase